MAPISARAVQAAPPIASLAGAVKRYAGVLALDNVDFSLRAGEVRALLGKNGAGKSTLIRLLTGAETPDEGCGRHSSAKALDAIGENRTRQAAALGVRAVYQELSLVQDMSIAENMFLGVWPRRLGILDHRTMATRASEALANLGLDIDPGDADRLAQPGRAPTGRDRARHDGRAAPRHPRRADELAGGRRGRAGVRRRAPHEGSAASR